MFDKVVVSTEDEEVAEKSRKAGADIIYRPEALAEDGVGTQDVAKHALEYEFNSHSNDYQYACVIYPCAPLLESRDLIDAWGRLMGSPLYSYCYSTYEDRRDCGAFYWGKAQAFCDRIPLEGNSIYFPLEYACDINTMDDWEKAEQLFEERYGV
jgi:CMP-N-acetylneuraminic acid synthetase